MRKEHACPRFNLGKYFTNFNETRRYTPLVKVFIVKNYCDRFCIFSKLERCLYITILAFAW